MCHCWDEEVAVCRIANYSRLLWEIEKTNDEIRGRARNSEDDIVTRRWWRRCVYHYVEKLFQCLKRLVDVLNSVKNLGYDPVCVDENEEDYLAGWVPILYSVACIQA